MKAICFDMDGVLIDSERHWREVSSEFLGLLIPSWTAEQQRSIHGLSVSEVHKLLVNEHALTLNFEEFLAQYRGLSTRIYGELCSLLEGVPEVLQRLEPLPLALVSSAPRAWMEIVLLRFELEKYFQVVIGAEDVSNNIKPLPECYLYAAKRLGFAVGDCVAIEDSAKGVLSAKAAGLRCLGYRNGFNEHQDLSACDFEFSNFSILTPELFEQEF